MYTLRPFASFDTFMVCKAKNPGLTEIFEYLTGKCHLLLLKYSNLQSILTHTANGIMFKHMVPILADCRN
ncbi:hypothetical protein FKM82_007646 [Ascaphus truei]